MLFINFGSSSIPEEPKATRVDIALTLPPQYGGDDLIAVAARAVNEARAECRRRGESLVLASIGAPDDPALAVAVTAALQGYKGQPGSVCVPCRRAESADQRYFDLQDPIWIEERNLAGIRVREGLRGMNSDGSPLPRPAKIHELAFLCFAPEDIPVVGADALRVDVPMVIPTRFNPTMALESDDTHGWAVASATRPHFFRDQILQTFEAREVIVGLPQHTGLAVTLAATVEHFFYGAPPLFAWVDENRRFDLGKVLDVTRARARGTQLHGEPTLGATQ